MLFIKSTFLDILLFIVVYIVKVGNRVGKIGFRLRIALVKLKGLESGKANKNRLSRRVLQRG